MHCPDQELLYAKTRGTTCCVLWEGVQRAMKSKSGGRQGAAERGAVGGVGGVPLGCRRFHVVLLLGARLEEVRTWQALERSPSLARETAAWTAEDLWLGLGWGPEERWLDARFHSALNSPLDHWAHRWLIGTGLWWRPPCFGARRRHLGNMNTLSQASSKLSCKADLKAEHKARANTSLSFTGMCRTVRPGSLQTESNVGRGTGGSAPWTWRSDWIGGVAEACEHYRRWEEWYELATSHQLLAIRTNGSCSWSQGPGTAPEKKPWACKVICWRHIMGALSCWQPWTGQDYLRLEDETSNRWEGNCASSGLLALNAKGGEAGDGGADNSCGEGSWWCAMIDEEPRTGMTIAQTWEWGNHWWKWGVWRHRNIRGNPHRGGVEREWPNNIASLFIRERGLTLRWRHPRHGWLRKWSLFAGERMWALDWRKASSCGDDAGRMTVFEGAMLTQFPTLPG